MVKEMTFEERFPTLSKINQPFDGTYSMSSVDECCKDNQRITEAIEKIRKLVVDTNTQDCLPWYLYLKDELGL